MLKFFKEWIAILEESDAKIRASGFVVVHGAGCSYLIPLPDVESLDRNEVEASDAVDVGFSIFTYNANN